ncbi:MAG: hypothetical protein ACRDL9_18415 [Trebonia sp.]
MAEHRQEFQRELETKVIELFAIVAEDLPKATHALLSGEGSELAVLASVSRPSTLSTRKSGIIRCVWAVDGEPAAVSTAYVLEACAGFPAVQDPGSPAESPATRA